MQKLLALAALVWFAGVAAAETLFDSAAVPTVAVSGESAPVELGVKFYSQVDGAIVGLRFYKNQYNVGQYVGNLWNLDGELLGQLTFANETLWGWQQAYFADPVYISANTTYIASYHTTGGNYSYDANYFSVARDNGENLVAPASFEAGGNGVYRYGESGFPEQTFNASNYWVDVIFVGGYGATAQSVTLAWDASISQETGGYRVHYGIESANYTQQLDVGDVLQAEVSNLSRGETYYFSVTAYPAPEHAENFTESDYSNEVSYVADPEIPLSQPYNLRCTVE